MKTRNYLFVLALLMFQYSFSQDSDQENDNVITKEVDQANEEIRGTNKAVKVAVSETKETINELKDTFKDTFGIGNGKSKSKSKGVVTIQISSVDYDNEYLNMMYSQLVKVRGVKKPSKNFNGGNVSIEANFKKGADALWQAISNEARSGFKIVSISDNTIMVKLKE